MPRSRHVPIVPCLARLAALLAVPAISVVIMVAIHHFDDGVLRQPVQVMPQAAQTEGAVSLLAPRG